MPSSQVLLDSRRKLQKFRNTLVILRIIHPPGTDMKDGLGRVSEVVVHAGEHPEFPAVIATPFGGFGVPPQSNAGPIELFARVVIATLRFLNRIKDGLFVTGNGGALGPPFLVTANMRFGFPVEPFEEGVFIQRKRTQTFREPPFSIGCRPGHSFVTGRKM